MPLISEFNGIKVYMYWSDHMPPHFHIHKGGEKALVLIASCDILAGKLSPATFRTVRGWWQRHMGELRENWERGQNSEPFQRIEL